MAPAPFKPIIESASMTMCPVRPDDFVFIHGNVLGGTFGKTEVETTARRLIEFFQLRCCWCEFTIDELGRFYKLKGWDPNAMFFGLMGAWYDDGGMGGWALPQHTYLCVDGHGKYCITDKFIDQCARNIKKKAA